MNRLYYDFHLHSCLSPCADDDNTPNNLAGTGVLAGLSLMALTDHNSCANCPAFFGAAERYGIVPVAGMELETTEEIHVVCLFATLEGAMEFDREVAKRRLQIKNKPSLYGNQLILDGDDNKIGDDPLLLACATTIPLSDVPELVTAHGGVCFPAHVDRQSNGILAILGDFPPDVPFHCAEIHDMKKAEELKKLHPELGGMGILSGSDAHILTDLRDAEFSIEFAADKSNPDALRSELIEKLKEGEI